MKTKFITLFFSLLSALVNAQNSEHLSFKGVPIDGTLNDYIIKLKQNGFRLLQIKDETALFNGDFAGYKDCNISVSTLKQKDIVHKIFVIFNHQDTWSRLSSNYFELKQMLTEKYGQPSDVIEKFESSYEPIDDQDRIHQLKFDNCKYFSEWKTDKGEIQLSIDHQSVTKCFVKLEYTDKINGAIINAKAKDDL